MPLIVLEGLDGAGKSTQIKLLKEFLEKRGLTYEYIHFPRFESPVYGELIARFLRGEFGDIDSVDPYIVALLFAGDRADAASKISQWLSEGKYVILDRYVASNVAYQCAKLSEQGRQDDLMRWILELEYSHNGIPQPDLALFLDVPFEFTRRNLTSKRGGDDRSYLNGAEDIHESSLGFQEKVREMYLRVADREDGNLKVVTCANAVGEMGTAEETFAKIAARLEDILGN